jgi:hypothetical protein
MRRLLTRAGLALAVLLSTWALWATTTRPAPAPAPPDAKILCPFLAMAPPPTRDALVFARGAAKNGMSGAMAAFVTLQITAQQKGMVALLRLEAPDLYRLDEVPGVSHDTRFARHLPALRAQADALAVDGRITFQQLVDLKRWVGEQEGHRIERGTASEIETSLAFLRAGGSLETWTVDVHELFTLLNGERPAVDAVVTPSDLERARAAADWDAP